jgi:hypothetical protein
MLLWAAYSDQWVLNHSVTFDGDNRRIYVAPSASTLQIKHLYSMWKQWVQTYDNSKYLPALRTIGGDPVGSGKYAGDIYFLVNNWQIIISHAVAVEGTLYNDAGGSPYIIEEGGGVIASVSNLAYALESAAVGLTPAQQLQLDKILQAVKTAIALSA